MNLHLVQEILFILAGGALLVVAIAIMLLVIRTLIFDRGRSLPRKRQGREERPR